MIKRHTSAATALCAGLLFAAPCIVPFASAQQYPAKPVRIVVSFAPGGSVDLVARLLGQKLQEAWGQQVIIDNRPGAGGNLSAELVARSAPDGYTLYMSSASFVVNASLYDKLPYDPVKDFEPVSLIASVQNVLVAHPSLPAKSVRELVALARRAPGRINYASTGSGSSGHLTMELFKSMAGIDLTHVPYKVIGQATSDLIAGHISLWFPSLPGALPHITTGKMMALAVSGARRSPALAKTPTVAEAGVPGFEATTWYPLLAPAGTPRPVVDRLHGQVTAILHASDVRERLTGQGVEPVGSTPAQLAEHIRTELPKWAKVVRLSGAKVD